MSPFVSIGATAFIVVFGAAMFGMFLRSRLPDHHLTTESRDAIKLATAIIGTLSALALGLMVASAKRSFDDASTELRTSSARVVLLDRVLAQYGPETASLRPALRALLEHRLHELQGEGPNAMNKVSDIEPAQKALRELSPQHDDQRWLQARALHLSGQISEMNWLRPETEAEGFPTIFIVFLVSWLAILFASFGILAPSNTTIVATLFVSALSVTGALVLIVDMDHPYLGLIRLSDAPLRLSLQHLGRP